MNIDEMKRSIGHLLDDRGLTTDYKEPSVRLLLYHLYVAMDIYRYMTSLEKNKAGFWYRTFKNSYRLTGFLKERKRNRERKIPPCTPLIKKGHLEKGTKTSQCAGQEFHDLSERQMAFWMELEEYIGKYDRQTILRFFYYWAEEDKRTGKMKYETQSSWNTKYRLAIWSKRSYEVNDQAAELRLAKAKGKQQATNQQTMTAERDDNNARLEQEIAERKAGAVSYEEWLKMKD